MELLHESVVLGSNFMLHFMHYQMTCLWAEHRLEFPVYQAILCLSFSFKHLIKVGVCRRELTFRMKNGRVGHNKWFLPPPCFPKILCNLNSGMYYRLMQVYQLLGVSEQTVMVSFWFALLIGHACVFTWSQAGGASVKCPPPINHVPAIAAFSDLGAKTLALETAWDVAVGQACETLKSRQVTPRTWCCWVRRKRSSSLFFFFLGKTIVFRVLFIYV